jgi:hypothetical protein
MQAFPRARRFLRLCVIIATVAIVAGGVGPVTAAAPDNDLPSGATAVPGLPFAIGQDTTEASVTGDDVGCGAGGGDLASVWYAFTPAADVRVEVDARASDYLVGVNLFVDTANEDGRADCSNDALAFDATGGTTYFLAFADVNEDGIVGGWLEALIQVAPPPLDIEMTLDPTARVHPKTGQALVTGTLTCDRPAEFAEIGVTVRLETGRFAVIGGGSASPACAPTPSTWSAPVSGENGRFIGGAATVQLTGFACDLQSCTEAADAGSVRFHRGTFALPEVDGSQSSSGLVAAAPVHDDIGSPRVIAALPYQDSVNTTGATIGATDPGYCFAPEFGQDPGSVWYEYTAVASGPLLATTFGSDYDTTLYAGTSDGTGGLDVFGCSDDTRSLASAVRFDAVAGQTYLFSAATSPWAGSTGGALIFTLDFGPPAQAVELRVEPTGSFDGYGNATIRGSVDCTAPSPAGSILIVELNQRVGNRSLPGVAFLDLEGCPAANIPFEIDVSSPYGKYLGGQATAQVIYAACSDFECASETVDLRIRLRR